MFGAVHQMICALVVCVVLATDVNIYHKQIYREKTFALRNFGLCITPDLKLGECIYWEDCKLGHHAIVPQKLSEEHKLYLRQNQCGYHDNRPLICCRADHRDVDKALTLNTFIAQPGECGRVLSSSGRVLSSSVRGSYGVELTNIDEFPWLALIEFTKNGVSQGHLCGGSLISRRYVITAAHCALAIPTDWQLSRVRLGEWDTATNPDCQISNDDSTRPHCVPPYQDIDVERIILHPEYNPSPSNQGNDIALLLLRSSVVYTNYIRPICLPQATTLSTNFSGKLMYVSGWDNYNMTTDSTKKLRAMVEGIALAKCRRIYSEKSIILKDGQMCASGKVFTDAMLSPSGGPLIALDTTTDTHYYFLAGIESFQPAHFGRLTWPSVYTRVGNYLDWICDNVDR